MDNHEALSAEDEQLLQQALMTLGTYITEHGQPQYVLIDDNDPRNEDDYSTWDYGTEPLPHDHTWRSTSIDVSPSNEGVA